MNKTIYTMCLMVLFTLLSCKDEAKTTTDEANKEAAPQTEKTIQLSNYSDENWTAGVGKEFSMFIVDNTPANLELLKNAKQLQFSDGSIVKVLGHNVANPFIQINIEGKASDFQELAAYPNTLIIQ